MSVLSTKGVDGQQGSNWIAPKTVAAAKIVDFKCEENANGKVNMHLVIMSTEEKADNPSDYGPGKLATSNRWYFTTDKAVKIALSRIATLRDALNVPQIDSVEAASFGLEDMIKYANGIKELIVGKEGYFLIGGERNDKGRVYAKIYDWDFVAPLTAEGRQKLTDKLNELGESIINDRSQGNVDGGSTTASSAIDKKIDLDSL